MQNEEKIKAETGMKKEYLTVPIEVLMDILKILFENGISQRIESILESENSICLEIQSDNHQPLHAKALENIRDIQGCFKDYQHKGVNDEWS